MPERDGAVWVGNLLGGPAGHLKQAGSKWGIRQPTHHDVGLSALPINQIESLLGMGWEWAGDAQHFGQTYRPTLGKALSSSNILVEMLKIKTKL